MLLNKIYHKIPIRKSFLTLIMFHFSVGSYEFSQTDIIVPN